MSTTDVRLECLRLAVESGAQPWQVIEQAERMLSFVEGRVRVMATRPVEPQVAQRASEHYEAFRNGEQR